MEPVAESFGFSNSVRAASQGRAIWNTENAGYVHLPRELFSKVITEIRQRKGLKLDLPDEDQYMD
jgi:elongation factor 2